MDDLSGFHLTREARNLEDDLPTRLMNTAGREKIISSQLDNADDIGSFNG
jgi:hypothetical protein